MKTQILIILMAAMFSIAHAQNVVNYGGIIYVVNGTTMVIEGDFENQLDGNMSNNGLVNITGNWTNNATSGNLLQGTTGMVAFNGTTTQNIDGSSRTWFNDLDIQNNVNIATETSVASILNLSGGSAFLGTVNLLMESGSGISGSGPTRYVVTQGSGQLVQEVGGSDLLFPLGTASSYIPATLANAGTTDNFGINVFADVLDGGTTGTTIPEIDNCVNNTWNITEETVGGSDLSITAQWNVSDEGPLFDRTQSGIGHFIDGWNGQEASSAAGANPYLLTRTGITSPGAFAVGDNNSPMVTIIFNEQDIFLYAGWAGISSYLVPVDSSVEEMLAPVINELIILQNQIEMYWPGQGINTIGNWDSHSGYKIKMSGDIQLTITGIPELNTTLNLFAGWNLIPVISQCNTDVADLFNGSSIVVVKEIGGTQIYWPYFGINSLQQLLPGKAYMVLMDTDDDITFPGCEKASPMGINQQTENISIGSDTKWNKVIPTNLSHIIALPQTAFSGIKIEKGDLVGAFDENGHCFGISSWDGANTSITLFGDDHTTAIKDGFGADETINFRLFKIETEEEVSMKAVYDVAFADNDGRFAAEGISAVVQFKHTSTGIFNNGEPEIRVFPNPATDFITIQSQYDGESELSIYNMHGLEVMSIRLTQSTTELNISMLARGTYLLKINNGKTTFVHRLIKQ